MSHSRGLGSTTGNCRDRKALFRCRRQNNFRRRVPVAGVGRLHDGIERRGERIVRTAEHRESGVAVDAEVVQAPPSSPGCPQPPAGVGCRYPGRVAAHLVGRTAGRRRRPRLTIAGGRFRLREWENYVGHQNNAPTRLSASHPLPGTSPDDLHRPPAEAAPGNEQAVVFRPTAAPSSQPPMSLHGNSCVS
jgi:hypothetical protein